MLTDPERVLVAHSAAEIVDLLAAVDEAQAKGKYVAGYLAYEAGAAFGLATQTDRSLAAAGDLLQPGSVPLAWMSVYAPEHARYVDLSQHPSPPEDGATPSSPRAGTAMRSDAQDPTPPVLDVTYDEYAADIAAVREFIAAGDTYQVNYTVRARFDLRRDPLDYFVERSLAHPVPYAAYLDLGPAQVITLSPELFLHRRGEIIESRPMKGTRPRGASVAADLDLAYELIGSEKDRAEDLMIVDMVRNDLGRVSLPGTVKVPSLFTVEPYATVWQMSSTVTGRLLPGVGVRTIMAATFPGASITGAPKHHTMEIIRDLEKEPRGVYTGSVGLFLPGGDFTCNLCIRTIVHRDGGCLLGVGSGVVWDSDAAEEYEETLTKAAFAFPVRAGSARVTDRTSAGPREAQSIVDIREAGLGLFETLLLEERAGERDAAVRGARAEDPLTRYRFLSEHLDRLAASATAFGLPFDREAALRLLADLATSDSGSLVTRLDLDPAGRLTLTVRPVPDPAGGSVDVILSPFRTDPDDRLLRHKTTLRSLYDREHVRARANGFAEVLFLNRLDRVTEGAITNVCARLGDRWVTPPPADGLLPGIWRAGFMTENDCEERSLTLDDLTAADEVVIGNSVRGTMRMGSLRLDCLEGLLGWEAPEQ